MQFSPLVTGLGWSRSGSGTWARRLRRLGFHAARVFERLRHRCDLAFRAWGARRLVREMQSWPDERLRDIGLRRSDLAGAIEGIRRPFHWTPDYDAAKTDSSRFGH